MKQHNPDFKAILTQAVKNEAAIRAGLCQPNPNPGSVLFGLIDAHSRVGDLIITLQLYLNELADDDDDCECGGDSNPSPTSSLTDIIDGERTDKLWEKLKRDNPFLKDMTDPPEDVV